MTQAVNPRIIKLQKHPKKLPDSSMLITQFQDAKENLQVCVFWGQKIDFYYMLIFFVKFLFINLYRLTSMLFNEGVGEGFLDVLGMNNRTFFWGRELILQVSL